MNLYLFHKQLKEAERLRLRKLYQKSVKEPNTLEGMYNRVRGVKNANTKKAFN